MEDGDHSSLEYWGGAGRNMSVIAHWSGGSGFSFRFLLVKSVSLSSLFLEEQQERLALFPF